MSKEGAQQAADAILATVEHIRPLLAGLGPDIQGGILAELTSIWLGGHHPELRQKIYALHIEYVVKLLPTNDAWQESKNKSEVN